MHIDNGVKFSIIRRRYKCKCGARQKGCGLQGTAPHATLGTWLPTMITMRGGKSPKLAEKGSKKALSVAGQTSGGGGTARNASNGGNSMVGKKRKKKKDKQLPSSTTSTGGTAGNAKSTSIITKETVKAPPASRIAAKATSGK